MITDHDLQQAIAECQAERNPTANTCIKLAAYYTIRQHLFPESPEMMGHGTQERYSYASAPEATVQIDSHSDFAGIVNGKESRRVWPVIDELMSTLQIMQPRLYNAVIEKLY